MPDLYVAEDTAGAELVLSWAGSDEQLRLSLSLPLGADENYGVDFWPTPEQAEQLGNALLDAVRVWGMDR